MVGHLSAHIGNLSFLKVIILRDNSFHGKIPSEIGKLFRLHFLYLNNNSFGGEIPNNLSGCTNLLQINLIDNNLKGRIPIELSSLPKLNALWISKNKFRGNIPPFLGNFSSLVELSLGGAEWEGSIPEDLGRLTRMEFLNLQLNNLTGTIPSSIYNLSRLYFLSLACNSLKGDLPTTIGLTLPNLEELYMALNRFTGTIPRSLSNSSQLKIISLSFNGFRGSIPIELGSLQNLSFILLNKNTLGTRGGNDLSFISYLANCTKLENLDLGFNLLKGPLHKSIANLSAQISVLSVPGNEIYGIIPPGMGNLVNLNFLSFEGMMLSGNIPSEFGMLQNLVELYMDYNKLTGQIPPTLGNLSSLSKIYLEENNLYGIIPHTLGKFRQLEVVSFAQNNLHGPIPASLVSLASIYSLDISYNSISGSLPLEIGKLNHLGMLDLSNNKLSGGLPNTLGSCLSLEYLYLSNNAFSGTIPPMFRGMRGLLEIDISCNNFSGSIPEFLSKSPLKLLNLSFNNLEGKVPTTGIFKNSSVVFVTGNNKLCGGIPTMKLPTCTVQHNKSRRTSFLLKVIAPTILVIAFLSLVASSFLLRYKRRSKNKTATTLPNNTFIKISYQELLQATDGFSEAKLIGFGSYGFVYKGFLHQTQSFIAVKVFNLRHKGASKSFISECKALRNVRHRNLLKIISVCSSTDYQNNDFKAIIYEFMPGGNLESWIHQQEVEDNTCKPRSLNLGERLSIVIDVATAIEHLHCHCQPPIIHGDLKPSNVLLDDDMVAHVGDFGLAKVLSKVSDSVGVESSSSMIKGSVGYIPPEYGTGACASIHGDVYSFGILLLEIFVAKRPTDDMFQGDMDLHNFIKISLSGQLMNVIDSNLLHQVHKVKELQDCLALVLRVGLGCSMKTSSERMNIKDAIRELNLARNIMIKPKGTIVV